MLSGASDGLAAATRAEALIELGRMSDAALIADHLLGTADAATRPAALFLAARTYWHDNRPFEALSQIIAFRALNADDAEGVLLQGAILGHIGDTTGVDEPYRLAMQLFSSLPAESNPGVLRLKAMTAARLGDWHDALTLLRQGLELTTDRRSLALEDATDLALDCLDRLDDPAQLDAAVSLAAEFSLISDGTACSHRAYAEALRGDFEGAVAALGLTTDQLEMANPIDQIRCATAHAVGHQPGRALPILLRNQGSLRVPDGFLFLAQAALSEQNVTEAREALARIADDQGAAAETARVAMDMLAAIERADRDDILRKLSLTWEERTPRVVELPGTTSAPESRWEGPTQGGEPRHDPASRVLDRLTREHVSALPVH